jgi:hypothetical protein
VGWVVGFWVGFSLGTCCRIWLEPLIHFILILHSLHTYRKCLKAFTHGWQSYCHKTIPYHHSKGDGPVVGFRWEYYWGCIGYDWDLPSPAYSYQIHFIHTKGVWHTLYIWWAVIWLYPYSTVTVITIALAKFRAESVDFWHVYCYVMIGSSHPLNTHTRSTSCIYKTLEILYMRWAVIWVCPYPTTTIITIALAKFGVRW